MADEVRTHPARVVSRTDAGGGMTRIVLDPGADVAATYRSPGQYVEVHTRGETGYFVLAGLPGAPRWDLVMRPGGGASDVLLGPAPDPVVAVTDAIGEGFPMGDLLGRPLLVALSGTGVAAGPPLVARRVSDGDASRTQVFVGVRRTVELPLAPHLDAWRAAGVTVVVCVSQDEAGAAGAAVFRGYVQDAVRASVVSGSVEAIFAVGVASMVGALREVAPALGIGAARVLTNH